MEFRGKFILVQKGLKAIQTWNHWVFNKFIRN